MLGGWVVYAIGAVYFDMVYLAFEWFFSLPCEFFLGMSLVFGLVFAVLISSQKDMKVWFQGGPSRGCKQWQRGVCCQCLSLNGL